MVTASACTAVNPDLRDRTDNLILDFKARTPKRVAPAPGAVPLPWEKGQYVVWISTVDGEPTLSRIAVHSVTDEGVWLAIEKLGYRTRSRQRVLYQRQPTTVEETRTLVRRIVTREDDGLEQTVDFDKPSDAFVPLMKDTLTRPLELLAIVTSPGAEAVTVPAGAFEGCLPATAQGSATGSGIDYQGLAHPKVPLNGLVRAFSKRRSAVVELVEFGFDGRGSIL